MNAQRRGGEREESAGEYEERGNERRGKPLQDMSTSRTLRPRAKFPKTRNIITDTKRPKSQNPSGPTAQNPRSTQTEITKSKPQVSRHKNTIWHLRLSANGPQDPTRGHTQRDGAGVRQPRTLTPNPQDTRRDRALSTRSQLPTACAAQCILSYAPAHAES